MADRKIEDYQDILDLPYHVSEHRTHMSMTDRAAQFSPFAALTGYDAAVKETERLTDQRLELDESEQQKLSERLKLLKSRLNDSSIVEITYFVPDERESLAMQNRAQARWLGLHRTSASQMHDKKRKSGGEYSTVTGVVKKLDELQRILIMTDGIIIPIEEIVELNGAIFRSINDSFAWKIILTIYNS
ncbi:MAG: hypothetical protein LUD12_02205 [Lachnospiraceae bacterium]|nr:hypothetical protein [Lachnospiraceae bacterium]